MTDIDGLDQVLDQTLSPQEVDKQAQVGPSTFGRKNLAFYLGNIKICSYIYGRIRFQIRIQLRSY